MNVKGKSPAKSNRKSKGDALAELYCSVSDTANRCGRALHDDAGPLLSAAGLRLQLLRMDHPGIEREAEPISVILDQAYERIRAISQELAPSPVLRVGLRAALERFAKPSAERPGIEVRSNYRVTSEVPVEAGCALYAAAQAVIGVASSFDATRIAITAQGSRQITIRIADNGRIRGRAKALSVARKIAAAQQLEMTAATKQGTIVSIRYALRRPAGG